MRHDRREDQGGGVRPARGELRGGRRRDVPLPVLAGVPEVGAAAPGIPRGLAPGGTREGHGQARGVHHGRPRHAHGEGHHTGASGNQLSVHPQETTSQAPGAHADPRDHAPRQPAWGVPGGVHSWRRAAQAHRAGAVLAPLTQRQETDRDRLHASPRAHDDGAHHQTLQAGLRAGDARDPRDDRRGRPGRYRPAARAPAPVPRGARVQRG
mmetsp:Transcript_5207/g.13091  ORF Transcript_5207/g.13091 Transcript_5207/m.13091 type:complete len:210 (+) Transcript_5207:487-1116(+)